MLQSVDTARQKLLSSLTPVSTETVALAQATGRILSQDILSPLALPSFSNSSMDGFAVQYDDIAQASEANPASLKVVADIPAGTVSQVVLAPGETARIMTGAPVPAGADAVVPVEHTDIDDRDPGVAAPPLVNVFLPVDRGAYIRVRGEDVTPGDLILPAGHQLRPQDTGMIAMLGLPEVSVYRRPRVAVLSTGDELLPPGAPPERGKIFESNSYAIGALVESAGAMSMPLGVARDTAASVQAKLDQAVEAGADLILSSAGVSVGAFDYVKNVVEQFGSLDFWRVNMRPGKPLAFGSYRGVPFVGLPGNPVSSFVAFEVFVRPALNLLRGFAAWERVVWDGVLDEPVSSDGRESYLRVFVSYDGGTPRARLTGHQGSGNQNSLVLANGLVIIPAGVRQLPAGSAVKIWSI